MFQQFNKITFHLAEKYPVINHLSTGGIPFYENEFLVATAPRAWHRHPNSVLVSLDVVDGLSQADINCKIVRFSNSNDITPLRCQCCFSQQRLGSTAGFSQAAISPIDTCLTMKLVFVLVIIGLFRRISVWTVCVLVTTLAATPCRDSVFQAPGILPLTAPWHLFRVPNEAGLPIWWWLGDWNRPIFFIDVYKNWPR